MIKIITYVVLALAVVGGGTYVYVQQSGNVSDEDNINGQADINADVDINAGGSSVTLRSLISAGRSVKCTFTNEDASAKTTGITYIADGKVSGEFDVVTKVSGGANYKGNMVIDGDTMYIWSSTMPQGIKAKVTASGQAAAQNPDGFVSYDQAVNYNCDSWSPDSSVFRVPSNITFLDVSATGSGSGSGSIPGVVPNDPSSQCASCELITDPSAKAQCKVSLGCN